MGQTLTHGVYLPDEGERNCYNGLAGNWQLLDGAVGTIAEHTSALAGKAPLVHTHTKSQITDFPAYGTTAGTICEGNDSRLSDARTPVAHTHTKSDVTNLFNSANTWTGLNTFQDGGIRIEDTAAVSAGGYGAAVYFQDYQGKRYGYIQPYVTSNNYKNIIIGADGTGRVQINSDVVPYASNTTNLGTSDKTWKTLNGINPGALSLPDISGADPIDFSQWDVSGAAWTNFYTPSENGWLHIAITDRATNSIHVFNSNGISASAYGNGAQSTGGTSRLVLLMPVLSGVRYVIIITANSISDVGKAEFIPCKGNV